VKAGSAVEQDRTYLVADDGPSTRLAVQVRHDGTLRLRWPLTVEDVTSPS
jgi:hypothetical protein